MKTYLSKEILAKLNTEEEVAAYTALKIEFDQMLTLTRTEVIAKVTVDSLNYNLFGSLETARYNKTKLENGLNSLIDMGLVKLISKGVKGFYILDIKGLEIKGKKQEYEKDEESEEVIEAYTMMEVEKEIWKIMSIDFKQKFNLLRLAEAVFGAFNNSKKKKYYKCGFASIETIMELSHIKSNKTVVEMFKLLEDNNIIYVRHSDKYTVVDGSIVKKVPNIYGRPSDKVTIDGYYEDRNYRTSKDESALEVCKKYEDKQEKAMEKPEAQKTVTKTYSSPAPIDDILAEDEELKAKINEKLKLTENTKPESEPAEEAVTTGITEEPENKHETETKVDNDDIFSDAPFSSQYKETSRVKKAKVTKNTIATEGQTPVGMPPRRPAGFVDETLTGDPEKDRKRGVFKSVDLNSIYKTPEEKEAAERIKQFYKPTALKINDWEDDELDTIDEEMACFEG